MSTAQHSLEPSGLLKLKSLSFKTPRAVYSAHRFLFRATNGYWNDLVSFIFRIVNGTYASIAQQPSVFAFGEQEVREVVSSLENDGYCILKQRLPEEVVAQLTELSMNTPVKCVMPVDDYSKSGSQFANQEIAVKDVNGRSARCVHDTDKILQSPIIQKVIFDPFLLSIAQGYLKIKPILSSVVMWWSFPVEDKKRFASAAAQEFHSDMDRLKFFNFFIYLTDVDENNGPHVFVRRTHKRLPSAFRKRGRFADTMVAEHYKDDVIELKGKKGTILAVDTRGLHKGKILESGSRLLLQVGFANSLFGEYYPKATVKQITPPLREHVQKHFESYFNFL